MSAIGDLAEDISPGMVQEIKEDLEKMLTELSFEQSWRDWFHKNTGIISHVINLNNNLDLLNKAVRLPMMYIRFIALADTANDANNYERKKELAGHINRLLKDSNLCIYNKSSKNIIYAIASRDGTGRYTLENIMTKKRSGSYKSLNDLFPIEFTLREIKDT